MLIMMSGGGLFKFVNSFASKKHASNLAWHPSDFIYLENGKYLKKILAIGWDARK